MDKQAGGAPDPTDPRCVNPPKGGAECVAFGIIVVVEDLLGGKTVVDLAESRATVAAQAAAYTLGNPLDTRDLLPPAVPAAHADAHEVGVSYTSGTVNVAASTIFSRCDVGTGTDRNLGAVTEAYGRGGVENLTISVSGARVFEMDLLDYELIAQGSAGATNAWTTCDYVQFHVLSGPGLAVCDSPATIYSGAPLLIAGHHQWGAVPFGTSHGYGGAVVHVQISAVAALVDVYVGYVSVAVHGGPATPATFHF